MFGQKWSIELRASQPLLLHIQMFTRLQPSQNNSKETEKMKVQQFN